MGRAFPQRRGRAVYEHSEVFVGLDVAKARHAVAVADGWRQGEVRYIGEIDADPASVRRMVSRLEKRHRRLHFCYEAGPTGYGLYRQIVAMVHACTAVAPSLIPKRPGDRVKTNRRDALQLARLLRADELTAVWVPDEAHEAVRELIRSREMAVDDLRRKRQSISSMMLRYGRAYPGKTTWGPRHRQWLQTQKFDHPGQQIALQEMLLAGFRCKRWDRTREVTKAGVSGGHLEEAGNEDGLSLHVAPANVMNLSPPDHRHRFVAGQCWPGGGQAAKTQPRPDQAFDPPMILLDDVIQIFALAQP